MSCGLAHNFGMHVNILNIPCAFERLSCCGFQSHFAIGVQLEWVYGKVRVKKFGSKTPFIIFLLNSRLDPSLKFGFSYCVENLQLRMPKTIATSSIGLEPYCKLLVYKFLLSFDEFLLS